MYKLNERQATMLFNILDELKEVEDMEWARLGNFEGLTIEEFRDILASLLHVLEVPEQEVSSQTRGTIEQLENVIDSLKAERADLVEAYADGCIGEAKLVQGLDRLNRIIMDVFVIIDALEIQMEVPVIREADEWTVTVDITKDDATALANLFVTINENMPGLKHVVDCIDEDTTVGEVLESLLPSLETLLEQIEL